MVFKINISHKGRAYSIEAEGKSLIGMNIGDKLDGSEISKELEGYELEISGGSDRSGFPHLPDIPGPEMRRVLLGYGRGMRKKPRGEKKKGSKPKGLRLRKSVRGREISSETVQINMRVLKEGKRKFEDLFEKSGEEEKS